MPSRPNILFVFPDQQRGDWTGYADAPVRTPNLDALLEDGVAFENAVTPSPVCGPARSCLAQGVEYDRTYVKDHHRQDYPLGAPTLYERLRDDAGYHTIGTGKFDLQKYSADRGTGVDGTNYHAENGFVDWVNVAEMLNHEFDEPVDPYQQFLVEEGLDGIFESEYPRSVHDAHPTTLPDDAYQDNWIGRRTEQLLREAPTDRPWFCQVNFVKPHNPWDVTEEMHTWYRDPDVEFPDPVDPDGEISREQHQEIRRNYAAMVENVDRRVGRLLDVVEERGELENTVVVYASDHGEMLGDHGMWYKRSPYRQSVGVPLLVSGPGVEARGVVEDPATTLDLHATFRDLAGIDTGENDSRSMRPYLAGETDAHRDVVTSGIYHWRLAFDGRHKLIRGFDPSVNYGLDRDDVDVYDETALTRALAEREPLLFDLAADPDERRNVAADRPDVFDRLDDALAEARLG
jgi:arylsulfatase A-like enzyme